MGKSTDIFGIRKFEIGDPGDGVMGTNLIEFNDLKEGSVQINFPDDSAKHIFTETNRKTPYRSFKEGGGAIEITGSLYGIHPNTLPEFLGGDSANNKWSINPEGETRNIYKSIRITTLNTNEAGDFMQIEAPLVLMTAKPSPNLTFNDLVTIDFKAFVNIPESSSGVKGTPFSIEYVPANTTPVTP